MRACGRGWGHVTRAMAIWQGDRWEYVAGAGDMWQGVGHVTRARGIWQGHTSNVKKSNMLTMNEVHKNFNLTQ